MGAGGRRGEIYSKLKSIADAYGDLVRSRYPDIPRRVSGYNLNYLLPENGFHVARALVGSEGTCATVLEATAGWWKARPNGCWWWWRTRIFSRPPIMFRRSWRTSRSGLRVSTTC